MILKFGGIVDVDKQPDLQDPESEDVKLVLTMYSLESFLFRRLNESSRQQETYVIDNLGPYAVALTKVIDNIQRKRSDRIIGEFVCYSGLSLPKSLVQEWK